MLRDNNVDLQERENFVKTIFIACKTVCRPGNFSLPIGLMMVMIKIEA